MKKSWANYLNMTKNNSHQIGKQGEIIYLKLNGANSQIPQTFR